MKKLRPFKHSIEYYFLLSVIKVIRFIPRRSGISLMRGLITVYCLVFRKYRNDSIRHLTRAFENEKSKKEIKRIAGDVFRHFATVGVDVIRIPMILREGMDCYIKAENTHYFEDTLKKGNGMILLTGHFGNWELMGAWMVWKKYPLRVIGAPLANPKLNQLLVETRNLIGYTNIAIGKETRAIIKALQEKCPLGMLMDQDTRMKGVYVNFFGRKANTPIGPIVLARRFKVPIVPAFMYIEKDLTYHLKFLAPLEFSNTGDTEKDIATDVQKCTDIYERIIREHPEQWVWMHRRWKRSQEGNNDGQHQRATKNNG